jgi:hypothetical protein
VTRRQPGALLVCLMLRGPDARVCTVMGARSWNCGQVKCVREEEGNGGSAFAYQRSGQ